MGTKNVIYGVAKKIKSKALKVVERKLGREDAHAQVFMGEGLIEIDPRQNPREYQASLIHECLHECFPQATEDEVLEAEKIIGDTLWEQNYRKISQ